MTAMLPSGAAQIFTPGGDAHVEGTGKKPGSAYRVRSDNPILAYQFNPRYEDASVVSSGASMLSTAASWGAEFFALGRPGSPPTPAGHEPLHSTVTIVAGLPGTNVEITVSAPTMAGGGVPALGAGAAYKGVLDEGDVLSFAALGADDDLSGTHVRADKPVAVFAGSQGNWDHTEEPMPPLPAWGKTFVATRVQWRKTGPTEFKILASEDATEVHFDAPPPIAGLMPAPFTLGRGQWKRVVLDPRRHPGLVAGVGEGSGGFTALTIVSASGAPGRPWPPSPALPLPDG